MKLGPDEIRVGTHILRIKEQKDGYAGIVVGKSETPVKGATRLAVETLLRARLAEAHPDFIGLDGARRRFLTLFPAGFSDAYLIGEGVKTGELAYKRRASAKARDMLPLDAALPADAGARALRLFGETNLIADRFTKAKLSDVLRGARADRFVAHARDFAMGDTSAACTAMVRDFRDEGVATWPCLTYLPFLWLPDRHLFLKPEFTQGFAQRIGHRFQVDYESRPNPATYASLLHMAATVAQSLGDLGPQDNIDIHSFMWVVMMYVDSDVPRSD